MRHRRLVWQLAPALVGIALAALVPATLYSLRGFHAFSQERTCAELRLMADVAADEARPLLDGPEAAVDALCKRLGRADDGRIRVTAILPDGRVIGDSRRDPTTMENHAGRPEIVAALHADWGNSQRLSPTLGMNMMYVARPVGRAGGGRLVVRTAIATTDIERAVQGLSARILWCGGVVGLVVVVVSLWLARRISRPVEGMAAAAGRFAEGTLSLRVPLPDTAELRTLARALNAMARQLDDRILTVTAQRNEAEAVLGSMAEGVLAVDASGRVVTANPALARLLGVDVITAHGRPLGEVVRDAGLQDFVQRILAGDPGAEVELTLPVAGGRHFHVHGARLQGEGNAAEGAVIVLHDVTQIHRLETVRRDFVANVSHELKTPITSIKGFVEALLDGGGDTDDEQTEQYLQIVARHADRLNAIVDDLLSLSRLEAEEATRRIPMEETALEPILAAARELSRVKAAAGDVRIDLDCPADLRGRVNGPLLEQAVVNLVDNAVKYSEPGTVVRVAAARDTGGVTISVADQGCGIGRDHLSRLFERFYVVDRGRSRKLGGTGLGLAIVKHISQVHGGTVTVESRLGAGSTFTIRLPAES